MITLEGLEVRDLTYFATVLDKLQASQLGLSATREPKFYIPAERFKTLSQGPTAGHWTGDNEEFKDQLRIAQVLISSNTKGETLVPPPSTDACGTG